MPISLRELYARKASNDAETQSRINRALYEQEYASGIITGSAVNSGAARNFYLGLTPTPQDIIYDTTPPPPVISAKELTTDTEDLLSLSHTASLSGGQMTTGDIKTLSKSYEDIFKKLDDGTATLDDYNNLTDWVNSMENPVPGFMNVVASIRSIWNKSASEKTFNLDTQFKNKKEALLKKIAQKGNWIQGKEIGAQEAFLDASKGLPASLDPLVQLKEFNKNFKPDEFSTSIDYYIKAEKGINFPSANPIAIDPFKQKIAKAGVKNLTPGTALFQKLGGEQAEDMLSASGAQLTQAFAGGAVVSGGFPRENLESVYKAQKELLGDALTKKSAYYIKLLEQAQKTGNKELFNESKAAIEKIQAWHNINNPKKNTVVESGFLPVASRIYEELKTSSISGFKSTARFFGKPLYSVFGSDQMVAKEKEAIMNLKVAPISVPMDINSDGKINTLDYDYYGNPVFSSTFHYQGKDGEWKTNWSAIAEISARVIGQMAPTLFLGGIAGRIGAALTEGVVGAEAAAAGLTTARNLNFAQKAAVKAKAINEFAGLRILDRIGTYATVTASTYDMMLDDELRYTKDINKAKARALGRASIEGFTEMIGVPEFGILKPGRYGISMANAVREVGLSSLPKKLTKTQLVGRVLGGVGTAGKRVLGQSISESFEEVAADMGNYMMTSYIKGHDPSYIKEDELTGQSLINTFTESFFSMLPFTGVTTSIQSINEYNSGQRLSAAQWAIANNPDVALSYIKSQQEKGKVTKDEALRMTNEVVKLKNTLASMEDINKVKDLRTLLDDPEAQRKYFNLVIHRNNLLEVDYDSLGEEEKKIINKHKVDMQLTEKAQSALTALKEKQKPLTPEEISELAQLKSKKEKTEEEQKREQTLSGRGELKGIDKIQFDYLNSLTRMTSFNRSKLSAEDYKKLVDAKIITQEDLTPKKEDLEKQLKDVDSKLYKYKELTDKYDSLTKEDKNKIVTDLFNQEIESVSQSTSPQELAELVKATTNQLNIIKTFNNLSPLDYDLRASLLEAATNRFEELVTKDENGVNGLTRTLLEEDTSQLGPTALQQKAAFVDQQTRQGYVDETSAQELMRKYLDPVYQNIQKFNESTQEEKIDALVNYFEQSNIEERFNLEDTLADWTVIVGGEEVQATIDEATFEAAQDKYYQLRGQNRAAGNVDASVSTGDISTPETGAGEVVETTPGAEVPGEYSTEGEVSTSTQDTIEKTENPSVDRFDKYAKDILTEMGKKNYPQTATQVAISLAATFSKRINEAISRGETVRAPASLHNTVVGIMKDVVTGKKTYDKAVEELQGLLNAQLPRTVAKNLTYRDKANFYLKVANVLTNYVEAEKGLSRQELESELGRTDIKIYPIDLSENATAEVHDSVDLQKKEAELKAQEAQVMSWINPLRTAAFETNEDVVSDDPARVRNAEILNFVQENPNPERKVQVSSREYFYKQILKDKYEDFKTRLKKAVEENDTSEATLTELQAFFGGDFFAVKPTATGKAELIYLIQEKGFGVLEGQSSIVTFVVNGQIEMFESNGKEYPFYANLSIAKHLENSLEATQGTQAREMPTIVTDFKNANPEAFDQAVREGLALISGLRNAVTSNPNVPIVFDLGYITQGHRIGTKIAPLSEVESPVQVTFKTKQTAENNGLTYPGVVGQAVGLIDGSPYLLFNRFIEEVGGRAEVEALAELIFNPETRAKFFDETKELIEYIANHYNIFQAGGRKLEFSTKKGVLEVFAVTIKNGKKEFTPITTPEQFISFMTKTDTPGVRYNVKKEGVGTNTRMFRLENGEVVEEEMSYNEFVRRTHKILASTDPTLRNKQVVFDEKSLREVVKPIVSTPPAAPTTPAEKKEEENWSFPEREKPTEKTKPSVTDYSPIAERILSYKDAEFLNAIKNDLEASNFLINVVGISADQNPVNLVKARVQNYLDKQKPAPTATVSDKKADTEKRRQEKYNTQYNALVAGQVLDNQGDSVYEEDKGIGANGLSTLTDKKYGHGHIRTSGLDSLKVLESLLDGSDFSGMFGQIGIGAYSTWESGKFIIVSNNINPTTNNKLNLNEIEVILNAGLSPFAQELANKYPNVVFKDFNGKKYDAELAALEGAKPAASKVETKVAPGKPAFPEKVPYDNVRAVIGSITKSIWEQLPQERKGSVKKGPDGELEYYVALEAKSNNLKVEGRIEIQFIDSKDPSLSNSISEELEKYYAPKKQIDEKGKVITEGEGFIKMPVNLNNMNWAQSSFQIFFDADAVSKISGKPSSTGRWAAFPKDITDKIDFQENLANIISQLSQETVIPNPSVEINPFKNLMDEAAAPPQGAPPIVENAFGEEELNKGQEQKKNCETTGKPGTFKKPPGFTKTKPGDKNKL